MLALDQSPPRLVLNQRTFSTAAAAAETADYLTWFQAEGSDESSPEGTPAAPAGRSSEMGSEKGSAARTEEESSAESREESAEVEGSAKSAEESSGSSGSEFKPPSQPSDPSQEDSSLEIEPSGVNDLAKEAANLSMESAPSPEVPMDVDVPVPAAVPGPAQDADAESEDEEEEAEEDLEPPTKKKRVASGSPPVSWFPFR